MENLIPNDVTRCTNFSCEVGHKCARRIQAGIDYSISEVQYRAYAKFGEIWQKEPCEMHISVDPDKNLMR